MSAFSGERDRVGKDDMVAASISSDEEITANLKKRLHSSIIFTSIGSVILSVNPFKNLGVFNQDVINKYKSKQAFEVPPHIFTLAEQAYRNLLTEERSQAVVISGESGAGKCLAFNTPVLMFDGSFRFIQDIRVGDSVMGDDSSPRTVLSLATGTEPMAQISQQHSSSSSSPSSSIPLFSCNVSHVLSLQTFNLSSIEAASASGYSKSFTVVWHDALLQSDAVAFDIVQRSRSFPSFALASAFKEALLAPRFARPGDSVLSLGTGQTVDISVHNFLLQKPHVRAALKGFNAPLLDFRNGSSIEQLPLHPYALGRWLADGGMLDVCTPFISTIDSSITRQLEHLVSDQLKIVPHAHSNTVAIVAATPGASNVFAEFICRNDMRQSKHIPASFKTASREARLALLAGIIDADATYSQSKNQYDIHIESPALLRDAAFVARSLGFRVLLHESRMSVFGSGLEQIPVAVERKKARSSASESFSYDVQVEELPVGQYYGFTLSGNKRFVVGDELAITHNTEAAKGVLEFIAAVSGGAGDTTIAAVKRVFLESNPITETFGNAKTVRNNNSSRFGKYFEIIFGKSRAGEPQGGRIRVFLLEKTRCVGPAQGERNFHSFYQVFNHAQARNWKLSRPQDFRVLSSGVLTVDGINDGKDFQETHNALQACQIQAADMVWQIIAGLLHLSNVTFTETPKGCDIANMDACNTAAALLGLPPQSLQTVLCFRSISSASARGTMYNKPNTVAEGNSARDALMCGIYEKLFLWLVEAINRAMVTSADGLTISILDIFGFENFDGNGNGFAQLAINYLNEALQKLFTDLTLKSEQAEYAAEGIPWTHIEFRNNDPQMQLIIGKPLSIFKCLDDAVLFGGAGTDESFLKALWKNFANRECFACEDPQQGGKHFVVRHYAGDVNYYSVGFIDANRDRMLDEMRDLMSISTLPIIVQSFSAAPGAMSPRGGAASSTSPRTAIAPPRGGGAAGAGPARGGQGGKQRPPNVSVQFQKSATELLQALYASNPCYIRCLKSNDTRSPLGFDDARMLQQVRYLGLAEQIRVRRAGYAHRVSYERFNKRYGLCHDSCYPSFNGNPRDGTTLLLNTMEISNSTYTFGKTKLFIRDPKVLTDVETFRVKRLELFGQQVAAFKCPKKPVESPNLLLELIKNLILPELGQFTVGRVGPNGEDLSIIYQAYPAVQSAYMMGEVQGSELQQALIQLLLDVTEVLKLHVVQQQKKGGWFKAFRNFFSRSKQTTA